MGLLAWRKFDLWIVRRLQGLGGASSLGYRVSAIAPPTEFFGPIR